jgi:hypothetical protein
VPYPQHVLRGGSIQAIPDDIGLAIGPRVSCKNRSPLFLTWALVASQYSLMALSAKGIPFMSPLAINRRKIPKQVSMCPMARIYPTRIKLGHSRFQIRRLSGSGSV